MGLGWLCFLIAAVVYCLTVEPTASFWDCPEFITTGYKLEVGHPPGAPFFMLMANFFSLFASDPSTVAKWVNIMNALLSAMCIMFLFWTITHLARKLFVEKWNQLNLTSFIAMEAAGLVGALIYTFSDTFWYSAVEGEVYAFSSAFTAVVFWLILKWEDAADKPHSDRWLVLIAYLVGLSIGVHLLNLLCIPAIVLVFYYRRFPNANLKGSLIALIISFVLIFVVLYGVIPGIITVGGWFELLFVNELGMSFNTGLYVYMILLFATVVWAIYESYVDKSQSRQNLSFILSIALLGIPFYGYGATAVLIGIVVLALLFYVLTRKRNRQPLVSARIKNTVMLSLLMVMIGYSSYAVIVIRSSANPPMDQNSPEDIFTLGNYLSRDQYGYRPLFYGQAYTSEYLAGDDGYIKMGKEAPVYQRKEKASAEAPDEYFIVEWKQHPEYAQNMFFPRMYSQAHTDAYESWMNGVKGRYVDSNYGMESVKMPTQLENLKFFLSYQCNFMYFRYFMWNFAGRQNDIQGHGDREHGNWITGIPAWDNFRLGDQSMLPDDIKSNKGHNVFYCLPLILGLLGLFWQAFRGRNGIRQFWVVFFLFFMTGLAIVVYLNQTPLQPRERDYAYAGSFYAFAIWCGLGVAAIIDLLGKNKALRSPIVASCVGLISLLVPVQMASQTWDDHDRSGRYTCRDFGENYLMSLQDAGYPIIYTNGDNDTFPLWYNQETEGVRTDARVCNLSYLQTDWYIDQMIRPAYDSPSVPISWPRIDYCTGTNDMVYIRTEFKAAIDAFKEANPEESEICFGKDPYELSSVLKIWVRDSVNERQRAAKDLIVKTLSIAGGYEANTSSDDKHPSKGVHVVPCDTLHMTIDKQAVRESGMKLMSDEIPDQMVISLSGHRYLGKSDMMMLEMIANCNWKRPIYVAMTVGQENYMNLGDNFVQEGLANRITPFTTKKDSTGLAQFDTEKTYDRMMNKFKYGNVSQRGIYLDETVLRMCDTHRRLFSDLAYYLIKEGKTDKAKKALAKMEEVLPEYNVPTTFRNGGIELIQSYNLLGNKKRATEIADKLWMNSKQWLDWYFSQDDYYKVSSLREMSIHNMIMKQVMQLMLDIDKNWIEKHQEEFIRYENSLQQLASY